MKKFRPVLGILFWLSFVCSSLGQELFPSTEPASTLPKKLLSPRLSFYNYQEPLGRPKFWTGLRLNFGVSRKLTLIGTLSASNHHPRNLPGSLNPLLNYFKNHHTKNYPPFPYGFEGFNIYGKYRLLSVDGEKKHFRIGVYGEAAWVLGIHDVAEPNLLGDNTGWGCGFIVTKLQNKMAISFTGGYIHPLKYQDEIITFKSGNSLLYNFSFGYRLFPVHYRDYEDLNVNVYLEFIGRKYQKGTLAIKDTEIDLKIFLPEDPYSYHSMIASSYMEIRPAIQIILNSRSRLDLGTAFPLIKKTYLNYYPLYFINFQKYLFKKK